MTIALLIIIALVALYVFLGYRYAPPDLAGFDQPEPELVKQPGDISTGHDQVLQTLKAYHSGPTPKNAQSARLAFAKVFSMPDTDATIHQVDVNGVPGEWVLAESADPNNRLLYIHGGAFVVGSPETHRFITTELSRRSGAAVLAIDYRMRPEHKMLACHEDARSAYDWIIKHGPNGESQVENLFVGGDSAGGNLTLSLLAWARDHGRRAADGAVTFAPLTDATMSSPTWKRNLSTDYFLGPSIGRVQKMPITLMRIAASLQSGRPVNDPTLSPLLGSLAGLPPTLIQVSREEMLYGDAVRYTNKANDQGSRVTLQAWPTLVHVFQGFEQLPEAHEALDLVSDFIRQIIRTKLESTRLIS